MKVPLRFEVLLWWVVAQFCMCGLTWVEEHDAIIRNDHRNCHNPMELSPVAGFVVPIFTLLPDSPEWIQFCSSEIKPEK